MAGRAVATTVESSICMKSAHPTIKGIMRAARAPCAVSWAEAAGKAAAVGSADMGELRRLARGRHDCNAGAGLPFAPCSKLGR